MNKTTKTINTTKDVQIVLKRLEAIKNDLSDVSQLITDLKPDGMIASRQIYELMEDIITHKSLKLRTAFNNSHVHLNPKTGKL